MVKSLGVLAELGRPLRHPELDSGSPAGATSNMQLHPQRFYSFHRIPPPMAKLKTQNPTAQPVEPLTDYQICHNIADLTATYNSQ